MTDIFGTPGADNITGTLASDNIFGSEGKNILRGDPGFLRYFFGTSVRIERAG